MRIVCALVLALTAALVAEESDLPADLEPAAAGTKFSTIKVGDLERRYILREPAGRKPDEKLPLVFVFHGGSGHAAQMERFSKFTELAGKERFIVVYPEGIDKSWNDGRMAEQIGAQKQNIDDVAFVTALLDKLIKENGADPKRVYACGISNGAIFSHRLAMELSERFAAIAGVCGSLAERLSEKFAPKEPVSVLLMNGTEDTFTPYDGGHVLKKRGKIISTDDIIKKWIKANRCSADGAKSPALDKDKDDGTRIYTTKWSGGRDGSEVMLMKVEGGGHTWPGGKQYLPELIIGKTSREFDATAAIWEFFKSHSKTGK
ncbi:MAG TPA: PHB depolymerase family esterase [Planctomycetota bacterium]|nr:PHB depolymerase family esterase [Planctomycetota bacterium]